MKTKITSICMGLLLVATLAIIITISCNKEKDHSAQLKALTINLTGIPDYNYRGGAILNWTYSGTANAQEVYQAILGQDFSKSKLIASVASSLRTYTVKGLTPGGNYLFWVRARQSNVWYLSNSVKIIASFPCCSSSGSCGVCNYCAQQCYPICCKDNGGFGYENGKTCISKSVCCSQNCGSSSSSSGGKSASSCSSNSTYCGSSSSSSSGSSSSSSGGK